MEDFYDKYSSLMDEMMEPSTAKMEAHAKEIADTTRVKEQTIRRISKLCDETMDNIDRLASSLAGKDLITYRDELRKECQDFLRRRDSVRDERMQLNLKYNALKERLEQSKKDLDKISEDNSSLENKIKNPELPLMLRLMGSKRH